MKVHNVGFDTLLEKKVDHVVAFKSLEKWEDAVRKHYPSADLWSSYGEERQINATIGKELVGYFVRGQGIIRFY